MSSPGIARRTFLGSAVAAVAAIAADELGLSPRGPIGLRAAHAAPHTALPVDELARLTLREAGEALRARRASSLELTDACLARIDAHQGSINAFITVARERARARARLLDDELRAGRPRGPLHGIPIALKDNIDTAGIRTTAASALFADRVPAEDAEVVRRLLAAGAVVVGKTNLDELALGGTTTTSHFGPTRNPWRLDRCAGGSSGGSAAAVAAELCFGALGTDTGGSIRIPSAWCGVVGLKPTYGRVSNRGVMPLVPTRDHVGPIARTVEDAALLLQAIAGYDAADTTSADAPVSDVVAACRAPVAALRIGVPRAMFFDKLEPDVGAAVEAALGVLRKLAASMREVALPAVNAVPATSLVETYAYHAPYLARTPGLYQPATRRRLEGAARIPAADYVLELHETARLRRAIADVFRDVDLLVAPTLRMSPRPIAETVEWTGADRPAPPEPSTTSPFNIFGLPAISVPCGFTRLGLPIGLQIAGPHFAEGRVLALARAFERATPWHERRPALAGAR